MNSQNHFVRTDFCFSYVTGICSYPCVTYTGTTWTVLKTETKKFLIDIWGTNCINGKDTLYFFADETKSVTHSTMHFHQQPKSIAAFSTSSFWCVTPICAYHSDTCTATARTGFSPKTNIICVSRTTVACVQIGRLYYICLLTAGTLAQQYSVMIHTKLVLPVQ
jgi:hypothetical protein